MSSVLNFRPYPGKQELFLSTKADIGIYGGRAGVGKTRMLLYESMRHIKNPEFGAVTFRRTMPEITNEGAVWDEAAKIFPFIGGVPVKSPQYKYTFPSGSTHSFRHIQHEDTLNAYHGAQIALMNFDELTHFLERMFWYMLGRNRSTCGIKPYLRASTNPDAESWVARFLEWWIDQESGLADETRVGKLRFFFRDGDEIVWANSSEELERRYKVKPTDILSVTFVNGNRIDNPGLFDKDPTYEAKLRAMQLVDRERLLHGNWNIRHTAGNMFRREWLPIAPIVLPRNARRIRYWDKAGTDENETDSRGKKKESAHSAGVLMAEVPPFWYIEDCQYGQWTPYARNKIIRDTAEQDRYMYGDSVFTWVEQEPGSGGKESALISINELAGYNIGAEIVRGSKVKRAKPLSAQAEHGFVKIIPGNWDYMGLRDELCAFPTVGIPRDRVDACSGAFNKLCLTHEPQVYHR